jgi:uncharacterized protein
LYYNKVVEDDDELSPAPGSRGTPSSARMTVRRRAGRGRYGRETIDAILDEGVVGHVAFVADEQPYAIPMLYGRDGDLLYLHGSPLSRLLGSLVGGVAVCFTVTLLDGLVLARSAFHHSVNYRSVVVLGAARPVEGLPERMAALRAFTERLIPGRWQEVRPPTTKELKAIRVLALSLDEASAKVRTGPPVDDEEDYALDTWAGVIPLRTVAGAPLPDPRLDGDIELSSAVSDWAARRVGGAVSDGP